MGILDDAIREHLDLKRRLGAEDEEIHKLESEAFGPPSRPGDPDFADQPGAEGAEGAEPAAASAVAEPPAPAAEPPAPPAEPEAEVPTPPAEPETTPAPEEPQLDEPEPQPSSALFDHSLEEPESSTALEPEPPAEPATPAPEPATGTDEQALPEPEPAAEPPIESFDTVEHHFEGAVEETGEGEVVEGELAPEPEGGTGEEDVLEETPEFLRDQPEDDELWFEQGEPKDFDF
jgi:hypothetical protein